MEADRRLTRQPPVHACAHMYQTTCLTRSMPKHTDHTETKQSRRTAQPRGRFRFLASAQPPFSAHAVGRAYMPPARGGENRLLTSAQPPFSLCHWACMHMPNSTTHKHAHACTEKHVDAGPNYQETAARNPRDSATESLGQGPPPWRLIKDQAFLPVKAARASGTPIQL